jgi:hypothetical protein
MTILTLKPASLLTFEVTRKLLPRSQKRNPGIVVEQDAVFQGAMPAFDLPLRHGMVWLAVGMRHPVFCQPRL